jgi:hypothetical protein
MMDTLAFVITTVALLVFVVFITWYTTYYITTNMLNTVNYVESLVTSALVHEFQNAISIASMGDVVGSFNYTLMLPTATVPIQGMALNYYITLYPKVGQVNNGNHLVLLYANVTVTMTMGPISRSVTVNNVMVYSSAQPYTIIAYNCTNPKNPNTYYSKTIVNPTWVSNVPLNLYDYNCTWSSARVQMGEAIIEVEKGS